MSSRAPVLIAYDGSDGAKAAVATVATRAYEELDRESERQADALAAAGASEANAAGLEATGIARRCADPTWTAIVDVAAELKCAAIVVGSRGRSAIASAVLGSVANSVVHHSSLPVVVAPAPRTRS